MAVVQSLNGATAELNQTFWGQNGLTIMVNKCFSQQLFALRPSSFAHTSTNVRRALIPSFNLHLLSTEDDQSAHLQPYIMFFFFFLFSLSFKKYLPSGTGAPGHIPGQ